MPVRLRFGIWLLLILLAAPVAAQDTARVLSPSEFRKILKAQRDSMFEARRVADSLAAAQDESSSDVSISIGNDVPHGGVDSVFEFIVLAISMGILFAIVGTFVVGFAAVSVFMDSGCLRYLIFGLGWIAAIFTGMFFGGIWEEVIGWGVIFSAGIHLGLWGYPIGWIYALQRAKQLPDEQYETWKQTLTGGALIGAGAGSILNLARSAAVFKGGGGSFGGGGASGSFSGSAAAGAQGTAAGSASGASAGGAAALGGAAGAAHGATASSSSDASPADSHSPSAQKQPTSWVQRQSARLSRWIHRFRWYHGCAFVLVALIFIPVGLGLAAWMDDPKVLIFVVSAIAATTLYRIWTRWAASTGSSADTDSSFHGGSASTTWN